MGWTTETVGPSGPHCKMLVGIGDGFVPVVCCHLPSDFKPEGPLEMPLVFHWLLIHLCLQVFLFCNLGEQKNTCFAFPTLFRFPGAFRLGLLQDLWLGGYLSAGTSILFIALIAAIPHSLYSDMCFYGRGLEVWLDRKSDFPSRLCFPGGLDCCKFSVTSVSDMLPGLSLVKNFSPTPSISGHPVNMLFPPGLSGTFPVIITASQITPKLSVFI